jgi:hypothetical protein
MNTPTLPRVSLPEVDLHGVTTLVADRASDVGDLARDAAADAWSTGLERVQDLAAAAVEVLEDIPDKAIALAGAVVPALRPTPRRSRKPLLLLAVAIASFAVVAWFLKKRRATTAEPYAVPTGPTATSVSEAS